VTDDELLVALISGRADDDLVRRAAVSSSPAVLVAAAVLDAGPEALGRAAAVAATTRDRQLVALAAAHLAGDDDRFDALVRDHLVDHPDHVVAAWVAAVHRSTRPDHHPRRTTC
jgi:hypothetical protein